MKNFEAAIFDMDGLLLDSERIALNTIIETFQEFNLEPDIDLFKRCIGTNSKLGEQIFEEGLRGKVDHKLFRKSWDEKYYAITMNESIPLKKGVIELLAFLQEAEIPKAIATSTKAEHARIKLKNAGLAGAFDFLVGGDQVEKSKPNPDIYLKAAEKLGANPKKCLALEDSENGVRAAFAAGMTVVQIPDIAEPSPTFREFGHIILGSLLEVPNYPF